MANLKVKTLSLGFLSTNCYIVFNESSKECIIIDPAAKEEKIIEFLEKEKLSPKAIFLTHAHADHILAVPMIKDKYKLNIYISNEESEILKNSEYNLSKYLFRKDYGIEADILLKDNEYIYLLDTKIKNIVTSGHTKGSSCYYFENEKLLFTGDTLFKGTYGRTDLYSGNMESLKSSIKNKLFILEDDITIFPGHGDCSKLLVEKKYNEILKVI